MCGDGGEEGDVEEERAVERRTERDEGGWKWRQDVTRGRRKQL